MGKMVLAVINLNNERISSLRIGYIQFAIFVRRSSTMVTFQCETPYTDSFVSVDLFSFVRYCPFRIHVMKTAPLYVWK